MPDNGKRRSDSDHLVVVAPDPRKHRDELMDMLSKVFSGGGYFRMLDNCLKGYIVGSRYDWSTSRIGILDGRIVTHWGVWDYQMRIGSARVRTAGSGMVATHGRYQRRGLMDRTIRQAIPAMDEAGYDVSVLFGIRDFYHRFGYVRAWPERAWVVKVNDLPRERPSIRPNRLPKGGMMRQVEDLYNHTYALATGTAVRPTFLRRNDRKDKGWCWCDRTGRITGYAIVQGWADKPEVLESAGDAEQLLRVLGMLCRRERVEEIRFVDLPWESPLRRRLSAGTARLETQYVRSGKAMIRNINLQRTITKLASELTRRLGRSGLADWTGKLTIADHGQKAGLEIVRGKVHAADKVGWQGKNDPGDSKVRRAWIHGGWEVASLLIGADNPYNIASICRTILGGDARDLLGVLFPDQHPGLCHWDRF